MAICNLGKTVRVKFIPVFVISFSFNLCIAQQAEPLSFPEVPVFRQVSYPFLPSITSHRFYFTSDRLMWFSTANGLTSFDGTSVQYHSTGYEAKGYDLNRIHIIAEDRTGNLFIGTRSGLYFFDRKSGQYKKFLYSFKEKQKPELIYVNSIYTDQDGIVFAGIAARGLMILDPSTGLMKHVNLDPGMPDSWENLGDNSVLSIAPHFSDSNLLWLGTGNGIYLLDKRTHRLTKNFNVINPTHDANGKPMERQDIRNMVVINDSVIWYNSWVGGFCRYNNTTGLVRVYIQKKLPGKKLDFTRVVITSFCRLTDRYFFLGAHNNQSGIFDAVSGALHPVNITGMRDYFDKLESVRLDRDNNIWVLRNGLLYVSVPVFSRIRSTDISAQPVPDNIANELLGVFYDRLTHRYLGAVRHAGGVYVFDSSFRLTTILPTPLITNAYTYKETGTDRITIDGSGRTWVTGQETYIQLPGRKNFDYIQNALPSLQWIGKKSGFTGLITTREGNILLRAGFGPVYHIDHKTLQTDTIKVQNVQDTGDHFIGNPSVLYDSVRSLVYFWSDRSVLQYHLVAKTLRKLNTRSFIGTPPANKLFIKLALDDAGRIWSMHENIGFRILDPQSLQCVDSFPVGSRGLRPEYYTNIISGGKDFMFLQGQNGVVVYHYKKQQSFLIDNTNGLKYPVPFSLLHCNDRLVLGQANSVQYYPTRDFYLNNFELHPRVNLILSDTSVVYERESAVPGASIRLSYKQNNLRISFSAPEFHFPERIEYAYQLSGFEDDWQYTSYFKREVSYTRLRPGKYIFRLKAQVRGGNWNIPVVEYAVMIRAAFWQTDLFKILLVLIPVLILILYFRFRLLSIRRKERQKAAHEKELLELEARALRAQMNPHFIFNCLNSIKSLIQDDQKDRSVQYLTTFSKLIRTLFNNADKNEISLYDELETCKYYLKLEAMRLDARFTWSVKMDETIDLKSIQVPALIVQPFIENAIWHGIMPKGSGHVALEVLRQNGNVEIRIDDNGIGREASRQNKAASQIGHQSRGVNLAQSRLELDNLLQQRKAKLQITDKTDNAGRISGTLVLISLEGED